LFRDNVVPNKEFFSSFRVYYGVFQGVVKDVFCFGRMTRELLLSGVTITVVLLLSFDQMDLMVWASERAVTLWDVCSCWWIVSIHSGYLSHVEVSVSRW
jgi:hypothetical protein